MSTPRVVIIDDDFSTELLVEQLRLRGYAAERVHEALSGEQLADKVRDADIVLIDLVLPGVQLPASGSRYAGLQVYRDIRDLDHSKLVAVFSLHMLPEVGDIVDSDDRLAFISKTSGMQHIVSEIDQLLGRSNTPSAPAPFIVHGHAEKDKLALKNYLQNTLGTPEPIILHEQANRGTTVIEKLERFGTPDRFVFVLLTPDDIASSADQSNDVKWRARQNVIFELGLFMGLLGRRSGKVILLHRGPLELPSDLAGLVYISIENGIPSAGEDIRREMNL